MKVTFAILAKGGYGLWTPLILEERIVFQIREKSSAITVMSNWVVLLMDGRVETLLRRQRM